MAVDAEFIDFAKANVRYWLAETADLEDTQLPALAQEVENILKAVEFAHAFVPIDVACLTDQLFPLFERHGFWQAGLTLTEASLSVERPPLQASLYNNAGALSRLLGHVERAIPLHQHAIALYQTVPNDEQLAVAHSYLASCYYLRHKYELASYETTVAIDLLRPTHQNSRGWAFAHDISGIIQLATGDSEAAIQHFQIAVNGWEATNQPVYRCRSLNNLGLSYTEQSQIANALRCYDDALSLAQSCQNHIEIVRALINKGLLLCDLAAYSNAETLLRRALDYLVQYPTERRQKAVAQNNLGYLLNLCGRPAEAVSWLEQAAQGWQRLEDNLHYGNTLGELSKCYVALHDYGRAVDYQELSISLLEQFPDNKWACQIVHEMKVEIEAGKREANFIIHPQKL